MRETLINTYLDYINNYLTIDLYAEHNGLSTTEAVALLKLAETVFNSIHPDN